MPTAHVRLKPIEWFQEIRHYPQQGGEGRYLRATCTYSDDSNVRLSTGETLSAFLAGDYSAAASHSLPQLAAMTREEDRTKNTA